MFPNTLGVFLDNCAMQLTSMVNLAKAGFTLRSREQFSDTIVRWILKLLLETLNVACQIINNHYAFNRNSYNFVRPGLHVSIVFQRR